MDGMPQLYKWEEVLLENVREGISRKFIAGNREMVAQINLKQGAIVPTHSHESEQLTYVLTGALKFSLDGRDVTVGPGEVLRIPSWMPHSAEAIDDTFELDIFSPIRQDWIDGTDDYFRK
jgi:quercetin dioxygenase-like cupin family protein